eukprot:10982-Heterococcus_DN1.PRE.3
MPVQLHCCCCCCYIEYDGLRGATAAARCVGAVLRSSRIATTAAATVCKRGTAMRRLTVAVASTTAAAAGTTTINARDRSV